MKCFVVDMEVEEEDEVTNGWEAVYLSPSDQSPHDCVARNQQLSGPMRKKRGCPQSRAQSRADPVLIECTSFYWLF